jgi:hypothetical protein
MKVIHDDCRVSRRAPFKLSGESILGESPMRCEGCGDTILYNFRTGAMKYRGSL